MSSSKTVVVLKGSQQWEDWYSIIKGRAQKADIWELIDPAKPTLPEAETKPTMPTTPSRDALDLYKLKLKEYKEQKRSLNDLSDLIEDSVASYLLPVLRGAESSSPYHYLKVLKQHIAPSDYLTRQTLILQLDELRKAPKRQNILKWLSDWENLARRAKVHGLPYVDGNDGAIAFLTALSHVDSEFTVGLMTEIQRNPTKVLEITYLTEHYRQRYRTLALAEGKSVSAFAATFRGEEQGKTTPKCQCGATHWYHECPYLNKDARPSGWVPGKEAQAKVAKALKNPRIKATVDAAILRHKSINPTQPKADKEPKQTSKQTSTTEDNGQDSSDGSRHSLATVIRTAFSSKSKVAATTLEQSWILDSGSSHHVCNRHMEHRFTKTRNATPKDTITSGNVTLPVTSFGDVTVNAMGPQGIKPLTLRDVAYVPTFMANLISITRAKRKGLDMDTYHMHLHRKGRTVYRFVIHQDLFFIELNKTDHSQQDSGSIKAGVAIRTLPAETLHNIFAHAGNNAIQALPEATDGIMIQEDTSLPQHCDTCALTKAHQLVSRSPKHEESSCKPFFRASVDMISMVTAFNGDQYITHLECTAINFILAKTHTLKSEVPDIILDFLQLLKVRFDCQTVFLRSDGEKSLGHSFSQELRRRGITWETSSPYTPQQNGNSEQSGHLIILKARALRVGANLPDRLWPETVQAAVYIFNRTPSRRLGWRTPFELLHGKKPSVSHLRVYGCKAYALDKNIPRNEKLKERALVGYLVGYDSTNIYRIWFPPEDRIIRTRDVTFDENSRYSPDNMEHYHEVPEAEEEPHTLVRPRIQLSNSDTEDSELEDVLTPDTSESEGEGVGADTTQGQMPTPMPTEDSCESSTPPQDESPELEAPQDLGGDLQLPQRRLLPVQYDTDPLATAEVGNRAPRADMISGYFTPENIIQGPRTRHQRRAQAAVIENNNWDDQSYLKAFVAGLSTREPMPKIHKDQLPLPPSNHSELMTHPFKDQFMEAMDEALKKNEHQEVWRRVPILNARKAGKQVIPLTWVYTYKFDEKGNLIKFKARICVRGDLQHTYQDTYAATLAFKILRFLLAIICAFDLEMRQFDVVNAFPHAPLDEEVYCSPPEGMNIASGLVLLLLRALYGLKQSPALWQKHFCKTLKSLGLRPVGDAPCLYFNDYLLVFFFVDDVIVAFKKKDEEYANAFQEKLFKVYEMRAMGEAQWFLAMRIVRDREKRQLWLSQESYINGLITLDIHAYQSMIGSINFAAVCTRPDIAFASTRLSEYLRNPSERHIHLAKRVLSYLAGTKHHSICYHGNSSDEKNIFTISSDASYANDIETRRSHQGSLYMLYDSPIDWRATKQPTVTTSTTEAELLALSETARQCYWWKRLFKQLDYNLGHLIKVQCDNKQTLRLMEENVAKLATKLRHVDIHSHWLRQETQAGNIHFRWTPTASMFADGLTKPLPRQKHRTFVAQLGLLPAPT